MSLRISIKSSKNETFRPIVKNYNKKEIVLGRHSSNDFVLDQDGVSDRHVRIRTAGEDKGSDKKIYVTDLGSAAGVSVGDKRIKAYKEIEVQPEEELKIGDFTLSTSLYKGAIKNGVKFFSKSNASDATAKVTEKTSAGKKIEVLKLREDSKATIELNADAEIKEEKKEVKTEKASVTTDSSVSSDKAILKVEAEKVIDFNFEATKLVTLSGRVVHHGKPVEGVKIDAGGLGTSTTGEGGVFSFIDIAEDSKFQVSASKDGFIFSVDNASGTLTGDTNIEFKAVQLLSVSGKVMNKGKPLAGVEIDSGEFGKAVTDASGAYTINNVPENTELNIVAKKGGYILKQAMAV